MGTTFFDYLHYPKVLLSLWKQDFGFQEGGLDHSLLLPTITKSCFRLEAGLGFAKTKHYPFWIIFFG